MKNKRFSLVEMVRGIIKEEDLTPEQEQLYQNLGRDYESFVTGLDDIVADKKVRATLQAGLKDGDVMDDKIAFSDATIAVSKLRPTQNEIDIGKSLNWPLEKNSAQLKDFLKGTNVVIMAPIITLNGKWVIDGHHRWSQVYAFNAKATMKCTNLKFPGMNPIEGLKAVQAAIAAVMGEVPQNTVEGTNLLIAPEDSVKKEIIRMIEGGSEGKKALRILKMFNKIQRPTAEAAANYIWQQISIMQTKAKPAAGAPERGFMPQTDEPSGGMPKLAQLLKKGVINWNEPL